MMPKTIVNHPGVQDCCRAIGCLEIEEGGPRYDVILKPGWFFAGKIDYGRMRTGFFRTVAEFKDAKPTYDGKG